MERINTGGIILFNADRSTKLVLEKFKVYRYHYHTKGKASNEF
jgi:hypothetical protein